MTEIVISPEVQEQIDRIIAENPRAANLFRELYANMHQAMEGVKSGQYKSFPDAMEAITGNRPVEVES